MDIVNFTPIPALIGGLMIGVASVGLLWLNGRIAGVSGIFGSVLTTRQTGNGWRILFLVGLMLGGLVWALSGGDVGSIVIKANTLELVGAGLLVGFGTQLGSGCTSGHGVCGIGRLSPRGLASTVVFIVTGALVVIVVRQMVGG